MSSQQALPHSQPARGSGDRLRREVLLPGIGGQYTFLHAEALEWLAAADPSSIHAVVTDPPYGLLEYTAEQLRKRRKGNGGVWRIPPSFDGCKRSPVPRFTVLTDEDKKKLSLFFEAFSALLFPVVVPGAHIFVATNPLLAHLVVNPFLKAGFEIRGTLIREVHTLRGGDRPKNAHEEFSGVTVMPKSCFEPWEIFRRPCEGRVQDNLRQWSTGGLRRFSEREPFKDLVKAPPARGEERQIAPHPSLKPQGFLRPLVRSSLPLGKGVILDPFAGSGSTLAAASAVGLQSIGLERNRDYYEMGVEAIPKLAALTV